MSVERSNLILGRLDRSAVGNCFSCFLIYVQLSGMNLVSLLKNNRKLDARSIHKAFTLVELLVVIAIIGTLVALLLPAVQSARESARRMQCVNNLKQLGLACINFESSEGAFPTAGGSVSEFLDSNSQAGPLYGYEYASWMFQVLPFIEEQNLFDMRNGTVVGNSFTDTGLAETAVSAFNCPSRYSRFGILGADVFRFGDYAGVMASHCDQGWTGFAWENNTSPRSSSEGSEEDLVWTGIIARGGHTNLSSKQVWKFPRVTYGKITDGSSNTIMLAEKAVALDRYTIDRNSPFQYWEIRGYYSAADWPTMRIFGAKTVDNCSFELVPVLGDSQDRPSSFNSSGPYKVEKGFGSAHPAVFLAVFGDGSVRSISFDAELLVLDQLGKRADGTIARL